MHCESAFLACHRSKRTMFPTLTVDVWTWGPTDNYFLSIRQQSWSPQSGFRTLSDLPSENLWKHCHSEIEPLSQWHSSHSLCRNCLLICCWPMKVIIISPYNQTQKGRHTIVLTWIHFPAKAQALDPLCVQSSLATKGWQCSCGTGTLTSAYQYISFTHALPHTIAKAFGFLKIQEGTNPEVNDVPDFG